MTKKPKKRVEGYEDIVDLMINFPEDIVTDPGFIDSIERTYTLEETLEVIMQFDPNETNLYCKNAKTLIDKGPSYYGGVQACDVCRDFAMNCSICPVKWVSLRHTNKEYKIPLICSMIPKSIAYLEANRGHDLKRIQQFTQLMLDEIGECVNENIEEYRSWALEYVYDNMTEERRKPYMDTFKKYLNPQKYGKALA
jgi:hypothetical protein